jgi:hypothetical protein
MEAKKNVDLEAKRILSKILKSALVIVLICGFGSLLWFGVFPGMSNEKITKYDKTIEALKDVVDKIPPGVTIKSGEDNINIKINGAGFDSYKYIKKEKEGKLDDGLDDRILIIGLFTIFAGWCFIEAINKIEKKIKSKRK